jgi:hypothetical protein
VTKTSVVLVVDARYGVGSDSTSDDARGCEDDLGTEPRAEFVALSNWLRKA